MGSSHGGGRASEGVAFSEPSAYAETLPTAVTEELRPGDQLADYRVEAVLGAGGMGVVYRAIEIPLGRRVALKLISPGRARDAGFRRRFLRESQLAASLDHSNVVPVYKAGESDGRLYIAMRFVEGIDLRTLLAREVPLLPERALALLGQVADALDAAHAQGLVHRDVKPANILVTEESGREHCYLSDFGLSREPERDLADGRSTSLSGTFAYTAPEQIGGKAVGPPTDVYSLACVLHECLSGRPPFAGRRATAVLFAHLQEEPPGLPGLPELDRVFGRALAKDPAERYESCAGFLRAVEGALRAPEVPPELDFPQPLVGREVDLAWLRRLWRQASRGRGRAAVVVGPRGIGKTHLAAALAREVAAEGALVSYARCVGRSESARAALAELGSTAQPTLLVLDDLDAADESLFQEVARTDGSLEGVPALVLATSRTANPGLTHRELAGLDSAAVAALAAAIAGDAADSLPLLELANETAGVPLHIHEAVNELLRTQATRQLEASADRAEAGWQEWRAAQAALTSNVVHLRRALGRFDAQRPVDVEDCPFKGLASFDVEDAELFFGREQLVAEVVARLAGTSLVGVVGPSGSGKSSVVRAGLLPALAGGALPGSEDWAQAVIRPGEHPLAELERARSGAPAARRVLAVDQLEEVFTICHDEEERAAFLEALVAAAADGPVVVAVRADFYGRFAPYGSFASLLAQSHVLVGPMGPEELRRVIELPAARAGLRCEPALVDSLVADVVDEPGGLPLLSTALVELWQRRESRTLRLEAYRLTGGVRGAVARLAEDAFEQLSAEQRTVARSILLRLAGGEGGTFTRRRASLSELDLETNEDVRRVISVLSEWRLVTVRHDELEVAHEALLREWPRLRGWLEEDSEGRRLHRHLIESAKEWDRAGRDPGELYRGARLAAALDWSGDHPSEPNELE
ncbi:MAG TPA: protein kinase, partial [Gaiellaceae bacterium]|nr:protein kinase [Gaiellaceae bacterium]